MGHFPQLLLVYHCCCVEVDDGNREASVVFLLLFKGVYAVLLQQHSQAGAFSKASLASDPYEGFFSKFLAL